jgi:YfiH family protein
MIHPPFLTSELLWRAGFSHAFFTRQGGVSEGAFASLNLSYEVGDRAEHVRENLGRAARALGLRPDAVYVPAQVHGADVLCLTGHESVHDVARIAADAVVAEQTGVAAGVRTADCVPILLADPATGRVAAVHAGWRGVAAEIVVRSVERLVARGSSAPALLAAIGPHIGPEAFEVGEDVAAELDRASDGSAVLRTSGRKPRVALARILHAQLRRAGLRSGNIEQLPGCTLRDADRFFSYRRDGKQSGRMLSVIAPRGVASSEQA